MNGTTGTRLQSAEIAALTSLRGFAAMAVILQHYCATAQGLTTSWVPSIVPHGYMAVDLFFDLSGFIMAYTYDKAFERRGIAEYGPFLAKRVARIAPLGLAMTVAFLACGLLATPFGQRGLFIDHANDRYGMAALALINGLQIQGFVGSANLNWPSWSISMELAAYATFPALAWLCLRRSATRATATAVVALTALAWLFAANGAESFDVAPRLTRCLAGFTVGILLHRLRERHALAFLARDGWTAAACAATLLALLSRRDLAIAATFPPLIYALSLNQGRVAAAMSRPVPYFLGTISFSIYLVHHIFRTPEAALVRHLHPTALTAPEAVAFAVAGTALAIPVAWLAHHIIEKPGRSWTMRLLRPARRPATASPLATTS